MDLFLDILLEIVMVLDTLLEQRRKVTFYMNLTLKSKSDNKQWSGSLEHSPRKRLQGFRALNKSAKLCVSLLFRRIQKGERLSREASLVTGRLCCTSQKIVRVWGEAMCVITRPLPMLLLLSVRVCESWGGKAIWYAQQTIRSSSSSETRESSAFRKRAREHSLGASLGNLA